MKTWKDVPHLFANGKFSIKFSVTTCQLYGTFNGYCSTTDWGNIHPNDCTLIARPISDMSDEEDMEWKWQCSKRVKYPAGFLYLLSIGVYPFDQDDFETGTVIDINTL